MRDVLSGQLETSVTRLAAEDDGRIQLICIRPTGAFKEFDERLTRIALRFTRFLRVIILRSWDFAAQHDWIGFVSSAVPTVLVVRAGKIIAKSVGDLPTMELEQIAHEHIAHA